MRAIFLAFCVLCACALDALAAERITSFVSDVVIAADSSLTVRETIDLVAEGNEIKRGILRDFPTTYTDRKGVRYVVGFEVLGVRRDGRDEPYALESISNGKRIRIGSKDVMLDEGPHRYEITYRTTRQLAYFADYDELYWNVTGSSWTFPIERAEAIIHLPKGASVLHHDAYTGPDGAQGKDFTVLASDGSLYRAQTTGTLAPGEGFTVAVGWPKGFVTEPTKADETRYFLLDNLGLIVIGLGVILTFFYYLYAWSRVGRDPPKGTIIPLFTPPSALGPAGMRYVWTQGFDDRTFAAALVGLAVKGRLKIIEDDAKDFTIERKPDSGAALTAAEAALYRAIPGGRTALKNTNHTTVSAFRSALENALEKEYENVAFVRNLKWLWLGIALSAISLTAGALLLPGEESLTGLFLAFWGSVWWGVLLVISWGLVKGLFKSRGFFSKAGSIFSLAFLIPFFVAGLVGPVAVLLGSGSPGLYFLAITAILLLVMNLVFHRLLRAPTVEGRKLLDRIEGFRMYMTTAEEERLKILHPPEKTPELFERYLPYALALDCENEWNTKFAAVLAAAAAAGATAPLWYSGNSWDAGRTGSFTNSLGTSFTATTSAASSAPPSRGSGSFGGGGSSGGGGGGGGGSGW
ncbi:DUF2207 domain-containing protein [soil metagenome]